MIDLEDNSLFKIIIATIYSIMYAYVHILYKYLHIYACVCLYINKINESNDIKYRKEELGSFYYYKVIIPPMKWYSVT